MDFLAHLTVADWITIVGLLVTLELGVVNGTIKLSNAIPDKWVPAVQAWCGILAAIGGGIITVLSRMVGVVAAALIVGSLLFPGGAMAAPLKFSTTGAPCDLAGLLPGCAKPGAKAATTQPSTDWLTKAMADIENVKSEIITGSIAALNEADADAATLTNPSDPTSFHDAISHACYPAQIKFLQSLPAAAAIQSPAPYNLIVLFQRKRDFVMLIQAGLPGYLKVGCAALLGDEAAILVKSLGLVGVTLAANAILPGSGGLALPALPALAL